MKAMILVASPKECCNLLNGDLSLLVRKKFPSDYVGWVYIYCTKNGALLFKEYSTNTYWAEEENKNYRPNYALNGKVVARFWCDKVEMIHYFLEPEQWYMTYDLGGGVLLQKSCLSFKELDDYLQGKKGYAIHITKLEIFDKPKEIKEFYTTKLDKQLPELFDNSIQLENGTWVKPLTRAPRNGYCYIEV